MNISGILVQTRPEKVEEVAAAIKESNLCEYHLHDELGRIIVTIEEENTEAEIKQLKKLQAMKNIIAADMMYSHSEDELDALRDDLDNGGKIPQWLNDPNAKAEDIQYNGDLKKRY